MLHAKLLLPLALLLAVLAVSACSSSLTPPGPIEVGESAVVELNAREYVATRINPASTIPQYEVTVVSRIRNTGSEPLSLGRCGDSVRPLYVVQLVQPSDPDGSAYNPNWACPAGGSLLVLAAGQARTDTVRLIAPTAVQNGRVRGALSGTMRISFAASVEVRSGEFTVRLP